MENESILFLLLHNMDHGGIIITVSCICGRLQGSRENRVKLFIMGSEEAYWNGRTCFWMDCDYPVDPGGKKYSFRGLWGNSALQPYDSNCHFDFVGEERSFIL